MTGGSLPGRRRVRRAAARLAAGAILAGCALNAVASASPAAADDTAPACDRKNPQYIKQTSYNLTGLAFPQSWRLATGKGVTVAVVDSGVDSRNPHLTDALLPGKSFIPLPANRDDQGHGTAVAGIIAARYVKPSALIGAAREAKILPVRVFDVEQQGETGTPTYPPNTLRIAKGIRWAAGHGADVINVSMSTDGNDAHLKALLSAVAYARSKDVVVVASSGDNSEATAEPQTRYPAGAPGVIGVAAANPAGAVDDWSKHGPQNDVSAPGADVLIPFFDAGDCVAGDQHAFTSWATGFVSGEAALLRERFPHESADQIAYRIMASADRPRQGERDDVQGWGMIQPYDALTMTLDPRRPGPVLPGAHRVPPPPPPATSVHKLSAAADPIAPLRRQALWWGLGTAGLAAVALVLRPLVRRSLEHG